MNTTIESHNFSAADEIWLKAASEDKFDPRIARARLYDLLPKEFDPQRIDRRFYASDKLTLVGTKRFRPDSKVLQNANILAEALRRKILSTPGVEGFDINLLSDELKISRMDMQEAVHALQNTAQYFTGLSNAIGSNYVERVHFSGPSGYDGPLKFKSIDSALERLFKVQGQTAGFQFSRAHFPTDESDHEASKTTRKTKQAMAVRKNTAFVIMAIDSTRPELIDTLDAIKSVASSFGISAFRADEIEHQDVITNVVLEQIRNCEYLVADLTHERPNVYYEIGYAHALDKKPILYRKRGTALHFDLSVHNVPEYSNVRELKDLLTKRFEAILGRSAA